MNFHFTKGYGEMLARFVDFMQNEVGSDLTKLNECPASTGLYILLSRQMFAEISPYIDINPKLLSEILHEYVISDDIVRGVKAIQTLTAGHEIDFIKSDVEHLYEMAALTCRDVAALDLLANREKYERQDGFSERLKAAVEQVNWHLEDTAEMSALLSQAYTQISAEQGIEDMQKRSVKAQNIYGIKDHRKLLDFFEYLKDTEVLDSKMDYVLFHNSIVTGNASALISEKNKSKLGSALSHFSRIIDGDRRKWLEDICSTGKLNRLQLLKNDANFGKWIEDLKDILE